jgi:hypothetical protein
MSLDLEKIKKEMQTLPDYKDQICLQGTEDNLDPFYGIGAEIFNNTGRKEKEFNVPIFDLPYINSIMKDLNMCRTRVMNLKSKTCYTYHQDSTKRIHIPVITNQNCFFIINNEVKHYPADGSYYLVNTTQYHTALNASKQDRIHIVGVI